jgi:hypothetical protein
LSQRAVPHKELAEVAVELGKHVVGGSAALVVRGIELALVTTVEVNVGVHSMIRKDPTLYR